jgi:uncharacterized protein (DUF1501 family)
MTNQEAQLLSRRAFMRKGVCATLGATGMLSTIANLRMLNAASSLQSELNGDGNYKALVCLFLYGGNDANNTIVPRDNLNYAAYAAARQNLAIPQNQLLAINPLTPDSRQYGLHPSMPEVQQLFGAGKVALLSNVGTLVAPVTRAQYQSGSVALPRQLFSHNDQSVQWQTSVSTGVSQTGWGGRIADLVQSLNENTRLSMSISVAGSNQLQVGRYVSQYQVSQNGDIALDGFTGRRNDRPREVAFRELIDAEKDNLFEMAYGDVLNRTLESNEVLGAALDAVPEPTVQFPNTSLGTQLRTIARMIKVGPTLGFRRQIFFASVGGYDTHSNQMGAHANLMSNLSQSMAAFYNATVEYDVDRDTTLFTASDFGRTFASNGVGSDHGWGNHQMIMGGAVRGGDMYGKFPQLVLGGPDDTDRGRWIPTTSVDEYTATLARWFGVADSDLPLILPNIGNFDRTNLGFL